MEKSIFSHISTFEIKQCVHSVGNLKKKKRVNCVFLISNFSELTSQWNYIVDVVVNTSNVGTFEQFWSSLNATSLPIQFDNNTNISDISITTRK